MSDDRYASIDKVCETCEFWNRKFSAIIPVGGKSLFGSTVTEAHMCESCNCAEADGLFGGVHTGIAMAFTHAQATCHDWRPDEEVFIEVLQDEYIASRNRRADVPGVAGPYWG